MSRKIKVAQFGLGPIGQSSIRLLAERKNFEIVGGIDIQPALSGKLVGDVCGLPSLTKAKIYPTFEEMWKKVKPDVVVHTAGSRAKITFEQCKPMLQKGLAVVSSCEELLFPAHRAPKETVAIDKLCRKSGGRILGTSERSFGLWGAGGERVDAETTVAEEDRERAGTGGVQEIVERR